MDTINYREIVQKVLRDYANWADPEGNANRSLVFDTTNDHYLYMLLEWRGEQRRYGITLHLDIIDGKIWVQRDGTEDGIIDDLLAAGVPKNHIVLGYRSPFVRQHTEFAVS
jgi:hypothetical protein